MYVETYIVRGTITQATYTVVLVYVGISVSVSVLRCAELETETDIGSEYQLQSLLFTDGGGSRNPTRQQLPKSKFTAFNCAAVSHRIRLHVLCMLLA
jgi:hypothetical protein